MYLNQNHQICTKYTSWDSPSWYWKWGSFALTKVIWPFRLEIPRNGVQHCSPGLSRGIIGFKRALVNGSFRKCIEIVCVMTLVIIILWPRILGGNARKKKYGKKLAGVGRKKLGGGRGGWTPSSPTSLGLVPVNLTESVNIIWHNPAPENGLCLATFYNVNTSIVTKFLKPLSNNTLTKLHATGEATDHHGTGSALVQLMACCLTTPRH